MCHSGFQVGHTAYKNVPMCLTFDFGVSYEYRLNFDNFKVKERSQM